MQHTSHSTTYKHYVDRKEVAKEMVKNGFRIFPIEEEIDLSVLKKDGRKIHKPDYTFELKKMMKNSLASSILKIKRDFRKGPP